MANFFTRVGMATYQALATWRRVFQDPEGEQSRKSFENRADSYRRLWSYYTNEVFTDLLQWAQYKRDYHLYREIRSIYNPTRRLVDFYAGQVYPGFLTADGQPLPDGTPSAIPFDEDMDEGLRDAIVQFWQWTNWQSGKAVMVRYGSATGDVLVEVADELNRGKVTANIVWPGLVDDLLLDAAGNVKAYALEYQVWDEAAGKSYVYRKEVDQEKFRTFKDEKPFSYDDSVGASWDNPYGFVPAVWATHRSGGTMHGDPAIAGSIGKIDELNSIVSHIHDQIHKQVDAPGILWTDDSVINLTDQVNRQATDEAADPAADRQSLLLLKGGDGGRYEAMAGGLNLTDALGHVTQLIHEIEQDHPELVMYRELRGMSQLTGPAAQRVMGDVDSSVREVSAGYDLQSVKLFQMAVAIGGWRANGNGWIGPLTSQQEKFRKFDLESYEDGKLDFSIGYRPLIPETETEKWQAQQAEWQAINAAVNAGVPLAMVLEEHGWDEEKITKMQDLKAQDRTLGEAVLAAFDQGRGGR